MNLLLTGASGFLGRNFLLGAPADWRIAAVYNNDAGFPEFLAGVANPNIQPLRCDLAVLEQVETLFERHGRVWDCCVHLAAKVDIPWSVRAPLPDLMINTGSLLNLLAGLQADRLIYFSSGAVYDGLSGEIPPHTPVSPTLPYAISKLASERYVEFFARRRQTLQNYLIVRFFGAYGPYEAPHKIYTRLVQAFAVEAKDSYTIYGDGRNLIDAMYVDDAVRAIVRMIRGSHWDDIVNLAAGSPMTIENLVRETAHALGRDPVNLEKVGVAHESNQFWGSTREMADLFGFQPVVTLPEGIRRFRDFLAANHSVRGSHHLH